jgi:hypothetical protein
MAIFIATNIKLHFFRQQIGSQNQLSNGTNIYEHGWLVVSTPPKNMSQLGLFFPIYG